MQKFIETSFFWRGIALTILSLAVLVNYSGKKSEHFDGLIKIVFRNDEAVEDENDNRGYVGVCTARVQELELADSKCFVVRDSKNGLLIAIPDDDGDIAELVKGKSNLFEMLLLQEQTNELLQKARDK